MISALINIKIFVVTRECGEDINMMQTPGCAYFNVATRTPTEVKDTQRINSQSLLIHSRDCGFPVIGRFLPRVPCHTIARDSARAQLLTNLS